MNEEFKDELEEDIDEEEFEDNLYLKSERKIIGWGAMKEYPAIISVLVSIFVPIVGLFFVGNQIEYRKKKYGHSSNLLLVLSSIISAIWWCAVIIVLIVIF